jgi:UDP-N-acetylmuramoylalanine--D-glutamate ligase
MTMAFDVTRKHVVVIGAGRSGRAAAELLAARGARVTLTDRDEAAIARAADLADHGVRAEAGPHRAELLNVADLIVLSPGVAPDQAAIADARRHGVPVIGELELASRWLDGRIVAITGTKGKSTTTTLTARMLAEAGMAATAGGNLGTAISTQVARSTADVVHVIEVSSFQLEMTETFHPWIAVLLNLSADHLDRHGSFEAYAEAKGRIFRNQTDTDWAVVNADDPPALALASRTRARRILFALDAPVDDGVTVEDGQIVRRAGGRTERLFPTTAVKLIGRHLLADVLAATAVASLVGVPPEAMTRAVEHFTGLEHALEPAGEIQGVRFVNDSKATNVAAARRAIESVGDGVIAIIGGRYKGGDFADLAESLSRHGRAVVAIGESAERVADGLHDVVPVHRAASMAEAVRRAFALAAPGGVVVLAPACSSFDMFEDYAARGRAFKSEVQRLAAEVRPAGRPM